MFVATRTFLQFLAEAVGAIMWSQSRILPGFCGPSTPIMPPNWPPKTLAHLGRRATFQDDARDCCLLDDDDLCTYLFSLDLCIPNLASKLPQLLT